MKTKKTSNPIVSRVVIALVSVSALALSACKPQSDENLTVQASPEILSLFVEGTPEGADPVKAVIGAQPGAKVVVTGVIGGVLHPFTEGYASFVLADDTLLFCNEMEDDHCETPWDACCEDPDKIRQMRLVVQAVDAEGLPVEQGLRGVGGLKELDVVTVSGVVDPQSTPDNLIVNLTSIVRA